MKNLACLLALLPLFLFAACGSEQISLEPTIEDPTRSKNVTTFTSYDEEYEDDSVLILPYATEGEVVATIQGEEYYYNPAYLFRLDHTRNWWELNKENVYQAIALELMAIEGKEPYYGMVIHEEDLVKRVNNNREKSSKLQDEEKEIFDEGLARIKESEIISEEEFWLGMNDYVKKASFIEEAALRIWSQQNESEIYDAYDYFRNAQKELREKYNVVFIEEYQ